MAANQLASKKKHVVSDNEITALNWKRESMAQQTMDLTQLKDVLKSLGYCTSGNFIKCITSGENPPIIRMERGKYVFNPKPIHIDRLKKVWDDYCYYGRNRVNKNTDEAQLKLDISRAIALLKQNGYKVYKPTIRYEEI